MMSTNRSERLKNLWPQKRALLLKALGKEPVQAEQSQRIPRRSQQNSAPLSFAQQRLWFLDRLSSQNPAYNLPAAVRLQGQLNLSALQQTLNEIVRRHSVSIGIIPISLLFICVNQRQSLVICGEEVLFF